MKNALLDLRQKSSTNFEKQQLKTLNTEDKDANLSKQNNNTSKNINSRHKTYLGVAPVGVYDFPINFLWGTATSAYQVEGDNTNDWSMWEKEGKRILYLQKIGQRPSNYICGRAVDSYRYFEEDLDLARALNNNAIRFGLEWSRIQPQKDMWETKAITHYQKLIQGARKRELKTVVTLWHWTNPIWFVKEGGWLNEKSVEYYLHYVETVIQEMGGGVDYWVTLNEPMLMANYGYLLGKFPPQRHSYFKFKKVVKNLITAHKAAYKVIHKHFPRAMVSITNLSNVFTPHRKWLISDVVLTKIAKEFGNKKFLQEINEYIDYIGVDYYRRIYIKTWPPFMSTKTKVLTDMGWEIYPAGIYEILKDLAKYKKPLIVLENGLADKDDTRRGGFIRDHLYYIHKAIKEGIDVRGYFYWSLLDNFEWDKGFAPKFGLYAVDRQTFARSPRPSAKIYAQICQQNKLIIE